MKQKPRVLIVDDEEPSLSFLAETVQDLGYEPELAQDGIEAVAKVELGVDLVLLDVRMPGMDGFEVARRIRRGRDGRDVPICMVTGETSREHRLRAVQAGANDYIAKPVDVTELQVRTAALLKTKEAQDAVKRHQAELEAVVEKRTAALRRSLENVVEAQRQTQEAYLDTLHRLAVAAEHKDEDTATHIHRVSCYCALLAEARKLPPGEVEVLRHASSMHDVGKIGIPDSILLKPGKLDPQEWEVMKRHAAIGARILSGSASELLQAGEVIALTHHEHWDGTGYPAGLAGENIPLMGRICAVADVFDVLVTKRPYKDPLPGEKAYSILRQLRATQFDPKVVDLFFENLDGVVGIQGEHAR